MGKRAEGRAVAAPKQRQAIARGGGRDNRAEGTGRDGTGAREATGSTPAGRADAGGTSMGQPPPLRAWGVGAEDRRPLPMVYVGSPIPERKNHHKTSTYQLLLRDSDRTRVGLVISCSCFRTGGARKRPGSATGRSRHWEPNSRGTAHLPSQPPQRRPEPGTPTHAAMRLFHRAPAWQRRSDGTQRSCAPGGGGGLLAGSPPIPLAEPQYDRSGLSGGDTTRGDVIPGTCRSSAAARSTGGHPTFASLTPPPPCLGQRPCVRPASAAAAVGGRPAVARQRQR